MTRQCDGCIVVHTGAMVRRGATREEIAEALGIAIAINAGRRWSIRRVIGTYSVRIESSDAGALPGASSG